MTLAHWVCASCGGWQEDFARPAACFVCSDVRNALPEDGYVFTTADAMREREERSALAMVWRQVDEGIVMFSNEPAVGIGSRGYLLLRPGGNVGFEAASWYTEEALAYIASVGGIATLSCSHPHGMGALWQLQRRFSPEVVMQRDAVRFTKAFAVDYVYDDGLVLDEGLSLHLVGGHYEGQAVLHHAERRALFCGDALKFETDERGAITGLSCHKAFHKRIPLSHEELRTYRRVIGALDFDQAFSPFGHGPGITTADAVRLYDQQLASRRTSVAPFPLSRPRTTS